MNIFKFFLILLLIAIAIGVAYNQGWLGPKKDLEHCQLDTEGRHYCE